MLEVGVEGGCILIYNIDKATLSATHFYGEAYK